MNHCTLNHLELQKTPFPTYVVDRGGYIDLPDESWDYRYTEDLIIFGGGKGQPQSNSELNALCEDVIEISKKYSAKFIYTLGGFHTNRIFDENPKTYITTTSTELTNQMKKLDVETTPQKSIITGFNGLILGFAKKTRNSRNWHVWGIKRARNTPIQGSNQHHQNFRKTHLS